MNLLGIDTSTNATAVCVERDDGKAFETLPEAAALSGPPGHARELLPAIFRELEAAGLPLAGLDAVAVGTGPGAYTGLRIGITTARSLAQAHDLPVRPVDSLAALAAGIEAPIALALLDARRGELFAALYVDGAERWPPFLTRPEGLLERLTAGGLAELGRPLAAGDGALRLRPALEAASVEVAPDDSRLHVVRALHVCRLAARAPALAAEAVLPRYLRAADATPSR
jgi:tRNA threonylcarbamoyladenosine biosynthesis protein TsaB